MAASDCGCHAPPAYVEKGGAHLFHVNPKSFSQYFPRHSYICIWFISIVINLLLCFSFLFLIETFVLLSTIFLKKNSKVIIDPKSCTLYVFTKLVHFILGIIIKNIEKF